MLEVVLQNPRSQGRAQGFAFALDGPHDFSAADYFGGGESGDFGGEHEVDFQLGAGLEKFIGFEEHAGAADVFGGADVPLFLAEAAVSQRQVKVESLRAGGGNFSGARGVDWSSGLGVHGDLQGRWCCVEHFAHYAFQVAKVERLLQQADAGEIGRAHV